MKPISPPGRATLKDIARTVGVDVSTVSKVLNDGGISVRPQTRQAIIDEASRVNYRPHALARNLRTQRTGALGILLPDLTNPIYAETVHGAMRQAEQSGYVMLIAEVADERTSAAAYMRLVSERRIDGLIIAVSAESSEMIAAIENNPVPHVFVNRRSSIGRSVTVDDQASGRLAAQTLIEAGHRRLGFIGASPELDTSRRRRHGFVEVCQAAGLPAVVEIAGPVSRRGGYDALHRLLDEAQRPTGVFAFNMLVGIGALAAARVRGVRVPDDLSVVTLDGEDAIFTAPPLTAIITPLAEMGARAVVELEAMIQGREPQDVVIDIPPKLVYRESVAPPPR
ncbi:LacI family DNA-binding transcriptional regulator [Mesorhizobium sp. M0895]|uniref:LacI family DNA-binding transcriptional regulator n=1 Tax=Mesorhizobium sp. M0895 TaxID=2957019 RepID=UPI00333A985B